MNSEFVAFAIFLMTFSYSSEAACKDSGQNCVNMLHLCHNHVYQSIMSSYCPASCGHCIGKCVDKAKNCYTWSSMGFCSPYYFSIYRMNFYCTKSCGLCKTKQRKSKKPKKQAEKSAQKPKPPPKSAPEKSKLYREDSKTTAAKLAGQPTTKTTATKAATTKRTTTANYKRQNSDATSNSPTIVPAATSTPPESTSVAFTSKNGVAGTRLLSVASSTTEGIRTSSGASEKLGGRTIAVGTKTMKSVTKVWKIPTSPAAADVPSTREKSRSIIKTTTRRRPLITTQNGISTSSRAAKKFGGSTINAVRTIVIKPMTKAWKIPTSPPAADAPTTREKSRSIIKTTTRRRPQATTQNGASSSTTEIISTSSGGSNNKEFGDSTVNAVGTTTVKPTPPESPSVPSTNENSFDRTTLSIVVSTTEGTSTSSRAAETFGGSTVNAVETTAIKPTLPERTFVASTSENVVDSSRLLSIASSTSEVISTSSRAAKKLGRSTINAVGRKTMKSVTKAWKMPTSPAAADVPITKETPRSIVKTTTGRTPQATAQNRASSTATVSSVTSLFEGTPSLVNDIEATKATTTWLPFGSSSTIGAAMTQTTDREGTSVTPSATTENIPTATGPIQNPTSRDSQLDKSTVLASSATSGPATPATSTSTLLLTSHLSTNVANTGTTRLPSTSIGLSTVAIDGSEATTNSEGTATTIRDEKSSTESQTITTKGFKTRVINLAETTLTDLQTSPTTKVLTTGMASTASTKDIGPVSQPLTATTIVNPAQSTPQALVYESTTTNRDVITDLTDASFATVTVFTTSTSSAAFTTAGQTLAQSASTKEETAEITSTSSNKETSTSSPSSGRYAFVIFLVYRGPFHHAFDRAYHNGFH
ncbi:unnamed protein product [Bursaphelenchus xylophilus]|uniref:(pine wood nematode) hypothetical protein n=1 Tax=Bursaphelenchus xylophilus TaxID=6326 RepID=A0A1I7SLG4_BURXY|nr:unnamed protein product [Bursaphelenchus xylophilus]CAG9129577.1 unnamed protein product [Bursaphelenchus xylophilus]